MGKIFLFFIIHFIPFVLHVGGKAAVNRDEILELADGEWRHVASMKHARSNHAVTVVNLGLTVCN